MRCTWLALAPLLAVAACGSTAQVTGVGAVASLGQSTGSLGADALSTPGLPEASSGLTGAGALSAGAAAGPRAGRQSGTGLTATQPSSPADPRVPSTTSATAAVRTPLTVGILNTGSNAALAASFGKQGTSVSWQATDEALIRWFNTRGGIGGRQIKPVFYTVDATSTSYVTDLEAACARFTQDARVDVVLTTVGTGSFDSFENCLAKAGVVNLEAYDQGSTDEGTFAKYPTLFTVGSPSVDRAVTATLQKLAATKYLGPGSQIGVIVESCPYNVRAYERSYAPLAKRLGLTVTRRDVSCVNGAGDLGSFLQQVSTAVLPFRSAGIDRVSFISDFESLALLGFSDQAQSQGWTPGYALTSAAHAGSNQAQLAQPQLPQMVGVGNLPDVDLTSRGTPTGDTARCRAMLAAEGVTGTGPADFSIMDTACDVFWLLDEGLVRSRGNTSGGALVPALSGLGSTHRSASVLQAGTTYSPGRRDGSPLSAVFAFQPACSCFRYTTPPTSS